MVYAGPGGAFLNTEIIDEMVKGYYEKNMVLESLVNKTAIKSSTVSFYTQSDKIMTGASDIAPGATFPVDNPLMQKGTAYMHQKGLGFRFKHIDQITNRVDILGPGLKGVAEAVNKLVEDAILNVMVAGAVQTQASSSASGFWDASVRTTRHPFEQIILAYDQMTSHWRKPKELIGSAKMISYLCTSEDFKASVDRAPSEGQAGENSIWGYIKNLGNIKLVAVNGDAIGNDNAYLTDMKSYITWNSLEGIQSAIEDHPGQFTDYFSWVNGNAYVADPRACVKLTNISES